MSFLYSNVYADILELKNGKVINGQYKGGTQGTLRFAVNNQIKVFSVNEVMALTFTSEGISSSSNTNANKPVATKHAHQAAKKTAIPAGTRLLVRTLEEIGTHNKKVGQRFSAKLEANLMVGGKKVIPAGATVYGRVLKSERGGIGARKAVIELTLTDIQINGQLYTIKTSNMKGEGESGGLGRKILKGAAIGGLADGSEGADTGARAGAGIGILAGGKHAGLKNGSLIEFSLIQALNL